jgi:hypothetical protein
MAALNSISRKTAPDAIPRLTRIERAAQDHHLPNKHQALHAAIKDGRVA